MLRQMELFAARLLNKGAGIAASLYIVDLQLQSGTAELCYKAGCFVLADRVSGPSIIWLTQFLFACISLALIISILHDIRVRNGRRL